MDAIDQLRILKSEIETAQPANAEDLEQFRIRFLGSRNELKPLFAAIRVIPADQRKSFGQQINAVKLLAEEKYEQLKSDMEESSGRTDVIHPDLTRPGYPIELGSRHPISLVMNKIIDIFSRIGFSIAENREIEDEWHNFSALNT